MLPVNISIIYAFIVHCYESHKIQSSSIKGLVAGTQFHLCCLDPSTNSVLENPSIHLLLNGPKREIPQGNDNRLPLTVPLLKNIITYLRDGCFGPYTDLLLETVFLTAFYGFLRGGKFTTRTESFDPSHVLTTLKHSKTDRDRKGTSVVISKTNSAFCPLTSMTRYLKSLPQASQQEPLFAKEEGKPMSLAWFASRLRLLCQYCGLPPDRFTAHSLRIGAATPEASIAPISMLKAMGRWLPPA